VFTHEQQANIRAWDDKKFSTPARLLPIKSDMQVQISQIAYLSTETAENSEDLWVVTAVTWPAWFDNRHFNAKRRRAGECLPQRNARSGN
jgi:hypothetical protein